jgi:hypothetical protein
MPTDKRTGKSYPDYEGVGDKTEPLPGMPNPIEQAQMDKKKEKEMKEIKPVKKMAKGGSVGSASKRADGCAQRGKTRGKIV